MRLQRFLSQQTGCSNRQSQQWLFNQDVRLNNRIETNGKAVVTPYCELWLKDKCLQKHELLYYMLHKPQGYLSATKDSQHPTVMELLPEAVRGALHIAGRLDLHSSGLLLLTSDGRWSKRVTEPKEKVGKTYRVQLAYPICPDTEDVFRRGIYFQCENITTQPAPLEQISPTDIRLTIFEGRYHQIKRMFAHVGNRVVGIHRESMGEIQLNSELAVGQCRVLTEPEISYYR